MDRTGADLYSAEDTEAPLPAPDITNRAAVHVARAMAGNVREQAVDMYKRMKVDSARPYFDVEGMKVLSRFATPRPFFHPMVNQAGFQFCTTAFSRVTTST